MYYIDANIGKKFYSINNEEQKVYEPQKEELLKKETDQMVAI